MRLTIGIATLFLLLLYAPGAAQQKSSPQLTIDQMINEVLYKAEKRKSLESTITALRMIHSQNEGLNNISNIQEEMIKRLRQDVSVANTTLLEHKIAIEQLNKEIDQYKWQRRDIERDNQSLKDELRDLRTTVETMRTQRNLNIQ